MTEAADGRSSPSEVFDLDESRAEEAIELLALAFEEDPAYRYFCSAERPGYRRRLRVVFRSVWALWRSSDQPVLGVVSGQGLAGLAMLQRPGGRFAAWPQLRWLLTVALFAGPRVPWRILGDMRIAEPARPAELHLYLMLLAVHPEFQGGGCARTLLEALQDRSERHPRSSGVCLETENPKNVSFYEHIGFRVIARNSYADLEIVTLFRSDESG